ncbi:hypothetical protein Nepgr_025225 [Nepenthes gracilis]|uniref:Uncharacterized protein n=1 Tax=Nepenthes gracilis TaxID=150966 RepID=A0AAD3XZB9_NEPGR|nr:hypothetical protein Nepgr_025225 [Nepenthes gracilis]
MAIYREGKFSMLLFLLSLSSCIDFSQFFVFSASSLSEHQFLSDYKPETDDNGSRFMYQAQIDKLEQLVRNLSEIVDKLESKFLDSSSFGSFKDSNQNSIAKDKTDGSNYGERKLGKEAVDEGFKGNVRAEEQHARSKTGSVTKYGPFWSERFQFVSAVNLDSVATCLNVLPFRDYEGLSKYVAVGDDRGRVYLFLKNGDVLVEFYTLTDSPVTAMLSYISAHKNDSFLATGHSNGMILLHRVWENVMTEERSSLHMESFKSFEIHEDGSPISILELHNVGRSRYILSANENGKITVFRENGTLYGSAMPTSRPLTFLKQRLLFLMETGAGSLDLRTMKIRESECEGLNHSLASNYVFDTTERSKAYGFTSTGDLIHVLLLGDIMNFKCMVRSRRRFDVVEPLALEAIKGYLLIIGQQNIHVYNVSSQHYIRSGSPRLVFSASIEEIKSSFLTSLGTDEDPRRGKTIPLIASDHEKLIIVGLGGGCVGMYGSKLPVSKGESNTMLWTSPVLFFILFLFGAWQFFAKKKEALTSWGPDDPFTSTSVTSGAPLASGSGDRAFTDSSSRSTEIMDLRSNGLRGLPRRYGTPPHYPGGAANPYRLTAMDSNSRPSVDPDFRTGSELKFRGSNIDSTGFPKTRENMYVNSQSVDDGN